jgi:hypothetical protein
MRRAIEKLALAGGFEQGSNAAVPGGIREIKMD